MGTYSLEPPRRNLIFHQTFDYYDEGLERFIDVSPQASDASVVGGSIDTRPGVIGQAAVFDNDTKLQIESVDDTRDYSAVTISGWGQSERPISSGTTITSFSIKLTDGTSHTLTHDAHEETDGWQFAVGRFTGNEMQLWHARPGHERARIVEKKSVTGTIDGKFNLTFTSDGEGYLDDIRMYDAVLGDTYIHDLYEMGSTQPLVDEVGEHWENNGLPYIEGMGNARLAGTLSSIGAEHLREADRVLSARHIAEAAGEELDAIGSLVGTRRSTDESDASYRARIIAQGSISRSSGTFHDLLSITANVLEIDEERVTLDQSWVVASDPARAIVRVLTEDVNDAGITGTDLTDALKSAVLAGHDLDVQFQNTPAFKLTDDSSTNDPTHGLTSDSTTDGGKLAGL